MFLQGNDAAAAEIARCCCSCRIKTLLQLIEIEASTVLRHCLRLLSKNNGMKMMLMMMMMKMIMLENTGNEDLVFLAIMMIWCYWSSLRTEDEIRISLDTFSKQSKMTRRCIRK